LILIIVLECIKKYFYIEYFAYKLKQGKKIMNWCELLNNHIHIN